MSSTDTTTGIQGSITKGEAITNQYSNSKKATNSSSELDKEAFLNLLMAQLKYQDPLDPMDNTEMVAQLAQFSALEQMNNLNSTMSNSSAYSMIGKYVYAQYYDENTHTTSEVEGYVDSVKVESGEAKLVIGDNKISYSDVKEVYDNEVDYNEKINGNIVNSQAVDLVGKYIQALTVDDDGNIKDYVEGKVDYVTFVNDAPVLHIGGKEVYSSDVMSVGSENMLLNKEVTYATSDTETVTGKVNSVDISGENIYLSVDGTKIEIMDLSSVMTALSLVGKNLNLGDVSGEISGVIIREKIPYVVVGDAEVKYSTAANAV